MPTRRLVLAALVAALALLPSAAQAGATTPQATSSSYVYGSFIDVCGPRATTECPLYNFAAREVISPAGGMTILDFGAPCFEPATQDWGTQLFNSQGCTPDATLVTLAQAWLRGYEANANRSGSPAYVLAAGTSNSLTAAIPGNAMSHGQMAAHGEAWFTNVVSPLVAYAQSLASPVTIWAGSDIEESSDGNWYDGQTTIAWVDAYAAASGASKPCAATHSAMLADYGDYVPNEPGWSQAAVYHVAWQAAPSCPVPEIYNAVNAAEWQSLNRYARAAGLPPMQFAGVLSQGGAGGSLSSDASWNSLAAASGQAAPFVSVIGLTGPIAPEVPDPPITVTAIPGPGLVTLTWSAPAWDGGVAVTRYTVSIYASSILLEELTFSGFPAAEKVIITGLAGGTSYRFYVRAGNRVGSGPQSFPSASVTPSAPFFVR